MLLAMALMQVYNVYSEHSEYQGLFGHCDRHLSGSTSVRDAVNRSLFNGPARHPPSEVFRYKKARRQRLHALVRRRSLWVQAPQKPAIRRALKQTSKRLLQLWCNDGIGCFSIRRRQALRRRLHPSNKKVISKSMAAG